MILNLHFYYIREHKYFSYDSIHHHKWKPLEYINKKFHTATVVVMYWAMIGFSRQKGISTITPPEGSWALIQYKDVILPV